MFCNFELEHAILRLKRTSATTIVSKTVCPNSFPVSTTLLTYHIHAQKAKEEAKPETKKAAKQAAHPASKPEAQSKATSKIIA